MDFSFATPFIFGERKITIAFLNTSESIPDSQETLNRKPSDFYRAKKRLTARGVSNKIKWATFGQRILRSGHIVPIQEIIGRFYDIRHVLAFDRKQEVSDDEDSIYKKCRDGKSEHTMSHDLYTGISEQAKASKHRLDDARALFNAVRWRGAMYMAGYAVECLLKTKLMQIYGCRNLHELEDELQRRGVLARHATIFTHQLELLLRLTQGFDRLRQNHTLWPQFNIVNRWMPAWRYTADLSNRQDAEDFLDAVETLIRWIENNV